MVVAAGQPLHASVGKLIGARTCTGVLVLNPRIVVTSAHCLVGRDGNLIKKPVTFVLNYYDDGAPLKLQGRIERVGSTRQYRGYTLRDGAMDWGIVLLDRAPANVHPLLLRSVSGSDIARLRIALSAFSIDVDNGRALAVDDRVSILSLRWGVYLHDSEWALGSSGAPLLVHTSEGLAVIAINSACLFAPRPGEGGALTMLHAAVPASSFEGAVREIQDRFARR
ncbi:MAG: hypothetical protein AB1749_00045 [Pseudomonadota bacterium]